MKLPNGWTAIVDDIKLRKYCLNADHGGGCHKALVFESVFGLTIDHVEELRGILLQAASQEEAVPGPFSKFGALFIIDFELQRNERSAIVRSSWMIRHGELRPRLVTCFVRRKKV
jgi:hypothetical protein